MNKELEALERIRKKLAKHYDIQNIYEWSNIEDDLETIETTLKALEIIKEKRVNVWCLLRVGLERYNNEFVNQKERQLTQEEFDLLKEILL